MNRRQRLRRRDRQGGQALVIMVFGLAAMLGITALIIDGGNAWAQQRGTQNAADAASLAGATEMVQNLGGSPRTDAQVLAAIQTKMADNQAAFNSAVYVDWNGATVATVGSAPGGTIPATAAGVKVHGNRDFRTYIAGIALLGSLSTGADATAIAGTLKSICSAESGCGLLPVTFSVNIENCDNTGSIQIGSSQWPLIDEDTARADMGVGQYEVIVPLCKVGPGGVGWLDFGCGNLGNQILDPCNAAFDIPAWIHTTTGNPNSVDSEMNTYDGKIVMLPLFDGTCRSVPNTGLLQDCTDPGNGNNLYFHIPRFTGFLLDHAYIQGNNHPECNTTPGGPPIGGNGSNGCLKGWFTRYVDQGTVGPFDPNQDQASALGVQLIR